MILSTNTPTSEYVIALILQGDHNKYCKLRSNCKISQNIPPLGYIGVPLDDRRIYYSSTEKLK